MFTRLLKFGFYALGISAVFIGSAFIVFGPSVTGNFFNAGLDLFIDSRTFSGLSAVDADSELRFYSVFWIAYGVLLIDAARQFSARKGRVPWLISVFFFGGIARLIGVVSMGWPHPLFVILMMIEIGLPIILWVCWTQSKKER